MKLTKRNIHDGEARKKKKEDVEESVARMVNAESTIRTVARLMETANGLMETANDDLRDLVDVADEIRARNALVRFDFHRQLMEALKVSWRLTVIDQKSAVVFRFTKTLKARKAWTKKPEPGGCSFAFSTPLA